MNKRVSILCLAGCIALSLCIGNEQAKGQPGRSEGNRLDGKWIEVDRSGRLLKQVTIRGRSIVETIDGQPEAGTLRVNNNQMTFYFPGADAESFRYQLSGDGSRIDFQDLRGRRISDFHWRRAAGTNMAPGNAPPVGSAPRNPGFPERPHTHAGSPPPANSSSQQPGANALQAEARRAAEYLNQVRANPAAFTRLHPTLAEVAAQPALRWNNALQKAAERKARWMARTGQFEHIMNIDGRSVGMNQWMREAGYPLTDVLENSQTNFENLYADSATANIGRNTIDAFLSEGKDGGHVKPILGRDFWGGCKDIGIGIATGNNGLTYVSLLVGSYDPWNPNTTPPNTGLPNTGLPNAEPPNSGLGPQNPNMQSPAPGTQENTIAGSTAAQQTAEFLNQVRQNPRAYRQFHPSLGDIDVRPVPALQWNTALQRAAERRAAHMARTGQFSLTMMIDGRRVGTNQWMREAGYDLPRQFRGEDSNFEVVAASRNGADAGIDGVRQILAEGKNGGRSTPLLGRGFWQNCENIGIGTARNARGETFVSIIVGPSTNSPSTSANPPPASPGQQASAVPGPPAGTSAPPQPPAGYTSGTSPGSAPAMGVERMPMIVGLTKRQAQQKLTDLNLQLDIRMYAADNPDRVSTEEVTTQFPEPGTQLSRGIRINFSYLRNPNSGNAPPAVRFVQVPHVEGKSVADAQRALARVGLTAKVSFPRFPDGNAAWNDRVNEALVATTSPPTSAQVKEGTEVTLSIRTEKVPSLVGMTDQQAAAALRRLGFNPSKGTSTINQPLAAAQINRVQGQVPAANTWLPGGFHVSYTILHSTYQGTNVAMPDVMNESERDAERAIVAAGLRYKGYNTGVAGHVVVTQLPAPGTPLAPGERVSIYFGPNRNTSTPNNQIVDNSTARPLGYQPGDNVIYRAALATLHGDTGAQYVSSNNPTGRAYIAQIVDNPELAPPHLQERVFPGSGRNFSGVYYYKHGYYQLQFIVAADADTAIVAFRGTDHSLQRNNYMNADDGLDSKLANGIPWTENANFEGLTTHPGWAKGANSVFDDIKNQLETLGAGRKTIIMTGHSMGGVMAAYTTYRLLNETNLFSNGKSHRLITFAAPRYAGEWKGGLGKGFRAKLHTLASKASSDFGMYSIEMTKSDGTRDPKTTAWQDGGVGLTVEDFINVHRVGTPIDFVRPADLNGDDLHGADVYFHAARADRNTPVSQPYGWVQFFCEAGYAAKFLCNYTYNGQPMQIENNMTLGKTEFHYVPGESSDISVTMKYLLGDYFLIGKRNYSSPPNRRIKLYGTVFAPKMENGEGGEIITGYGAYHWTRDAGLAAVNWTEGAGEDALDWSETAISDVENVLDTFWNGRPVVQPSRVTWPDSLPADVREYGLRMTHIECTAAPGSTLGFGEGNELEVFGSIGVSPQGRVIVTKGTNAILWNKRPGDRVSIAKGSNRRYAMPDNAIKRFYVRESDLQDAKIKIVTGLVEHDDDPNDPFTRGTHLVALKDVTWDKSHSSFEVRVNDGDNDQKLRVHLYLVRLR